MTDLSVREHLKEYGRKFRNMRHKAKLSQLTAARMIGCSQAIISHIECGYMLPPTRIECALFELYKKGFNEL